MTNSPQGRRPYQEDEWLAKPKDSLFAVFDGHGGGGVSHCAAATFRDHFVASLASMGPSMGSVWEATYRSTQEAYRSFDWTATEELKKKRALPNYAHQGREGATAVAVYVNQERGVLSVANAGDSRCVLCRRDGSALALSEDHKPLNPGEFQRLKSEGFVVRRERIYKVDSATGNIVGGGLNLSRALGDFFYGAGVPHTPEVREHIIRPGDQFLILASDGLWDVFSNERACDEARKGAKSLVFHAYTQGSSDNITALIVHLQGGTTNQQEDGARAQGT